MNHRQAEYNRLKAETEERVNQILQQRRQEREYQRKMIFFLRAEEERLRKLHEEEEARKRDGIFLQKQCACYYSFIFSVLLLKKVEMSKIR